MPITVRRVDSAEVSTIVEAMDRVMQRAYSPPSFRQQIEIFVALQPDGVIVAEDGPRVVGTGCCIAYPDAGFGWIGLIATEPTHERRGIGRRITDEALRVLGANQCAAALDASFAGGPLYERMGFVDHGVTRVLEAASRGPIRIRRATALTHADLDEVIAYDREVFGADRGELVRLLFEQYANRAGVIRGDDGAIEGYVIAHLDSLGPLLADDADALTDLVAFASALRWVVPLRVRVPPECTQLDVFERLGFQDVRELRHMRHGIEHLPGDTSRYCSRVSLAFG